MNDDWITVTDAIPAYNVMRVEMRDTKGQQLIVTYDKHTNTWTSCEPLRLVDGSIEDKITAIKATLNKMEQVAEGMRRTSTTIENVVQWKLPDYTIDLLSFFSRLNHENYLEFRDLVCSVYRKEMGIGSNVENHHVIELIRIEMPELLEQHIQRN